jgi:hypothetical protein
MTATVTTLPTWPKDVPVHPAAELFPLMGGNEFSELVADIRENGLVAAIVRTSDGLILDGRNRYRACLLAEVEPTFETHDGEPWQFVISTNLHRRHLTDSQRAMVAAKIAERARGRAAKTPSGVFAEKVPTHSEASRLLNVSPSQIDRARKVQKNGTDALKDAVEAGAVPVATAARVSSLPAIKQDEYVERVAAGQNPVEAAPSVAAAVTVPVRPAFATQRRKPITDSADDVGWEMRKCAEKLARLLADDRYPKNEEQVALALRGHLLFAADTVAAALDKLGNKSHKESN